MNLLKQTHKKPFWKFLGGVYLGAGVGFVKNDIQEISRVNVYNPTTKKYELSPVDLSGRYLSLPLMAGLDFKINRQLESPMLIGLNTQFNIIPYSYLDGYIQNNNRRAGLYNFTSLSIKYRFSRHNFLNRNIYPLERTGL